MSQVSHLWGTECSCWRIFCWLCTLVMKEKKNPAHPPLSLQLRSCWKRSTGLPGLISSLRGLIGRPQPTDIWLCLGTRWLTDPLPARSAAQAVPSHWRTQFTLLRWPTWPIKTERAGYKTNMYAATYRKTTLWRIVQMYRSDICGMENQSATHHASCGHILWR